MASYTNAGAPELASSWWISTSANGLRLADIARLAYQLDANLFHEIALIGLCDEDFARECD
jgi:hypothetical protein